MRNVLITGIPRAGTTLAAALADSLPDTVCLSEPDWHWHKHTGGKLDIGPDKDGVNFAKWLVGDFVHIRKKLLSGEPVMDRRAEGGGATTNYVRLNPESQKMETLYKTMPLSRPELSPDFTLAIKHNGPYLTALSPLIDLQFFTIVALIRHPVDVIHSWRQLSLPVSSGKMHDAARCWPEMEEHTNEKLDVLQRQVYIYDLICERLYSLRDQLHILPYETMIANPTLLAHYMGVEGEVDAKLVRKEAAKEIPERENIIHALKIYGRHYTTFYPAV